MCEMSKTSYNLGRME